MQFPRALLLCWAAVPALALLLHAPEALGQYTVTLQASPNPALDGVPVTFTIHVETPSGPAAGLAGICVVPVGSDFCGVVLEPLDSAGTRTIAESFPPGSYYVTANFISAPNSMPPVSSPTLTLVVLAASAAIPTLSPLSLAVFGLSLATLGVVALRVGCCGR